MAVEKFENEKWQGKKQGINFRLQTALEFIDKGPVLDLGCGDGIFLQLLKEKGIKGQGLDISEVAVQKAKSQGLLVEQFDFSQKPLPFADNSFAAVVLLDVLEHLYQPKDILQEAARLADELIVAVPNFNSLPARLQTLLGRVPENNLPKKGHIYWFNLSVLSEILQNSGWKIIELKTNTIFNNRPLLGHFFTLLANLLPNVFALSFVVKARKYG